MIHLYKMICGHFNRREHIVTKWTLQNIDFAPEEIDLHYPLICIIQRCNAIKVKFMGDRKMRYKLFEAGLMFTK